MSNRYKNVNKGNMAPHGSMEPTVITLNFYLTLWKNCIIIILL